MADKWVLIFKQDVTVQAIQSLCVEAEAVSQGRFSGSCRRLHTGSLLKGISGGSGLLTHLLLLTVFCRPSPRLACVVYDPSASDFAGTFTAADVHRIQAAFSDSLLIVEKDGIMQVSSPVSAFILSGLTGYHRSATTAQSLRLDGKFVKCCITLIRRRKGKEFYCFASNGA